MYYLWFGVSTKSSLSWLIVNEVEMPEHLRHAVRKEFKAWGVENVICKLLRHSLPIPTEGIRGYYLEDIKKCFGERAISILEMFSGGGFCGSEMTMGLL